MPDVTEAPARRRRSNPPAGSKNARSMSRKKRCESRAAALRSIRDPYLLHWRDISSLLMPRTGMFLLADRSRGGRKNQAIYDGTGTHSLRITAAGIMTGSSYPARPWFGVTTADVSMRKRSAVRRWTDLLTESIRSVLQRSNAYRALHQVYEEMVAYGTGACLVLPDAEDIVRLHPMTAGEYMLATDAKGRVNTMFRELDMTVSQVVEEFGYYQCSRSVRDRWDNGDLDTSVAVMHVIEPREYYDPSKRDTTNMPWRSVHYEIGSSEDMVLRESGYRKFPVLAPRWRIEANSAYGGSPGMDALGSVAQLQQEQHRKSQGIDLQTLPPVQAPLELQNGEVNLLPGGVTYHNAAGANSGVREVFASRVPLGDLTADIVEVRQRIRDAFFTDLFLLVTNSTGDKTVPEIQELQQEKLMVLGPVIENVDTELLKPLIELVFDELVARSMVPPAPEEMHGQALEIEFVSMLAQAQKAIGTNTIDRFIGNLMAVGKVKPEVFDKFDAYEWVDRAAEMLGVPAAMIVPTDDALKVAEARAKAQAAAQQAESVGVAAKAVRDFAAAPTDAPNALTGLDAVGLFSGLGSP